MCKHVGGILYLGGRSPGSIEEAMDSPTPAFSGALGAPAVHDMTTAGGTAGEDDCWVTIVCAVTLSTSVAGTGAGAESEGDASGVRRSSGPGVEVKDRAARWYQWRAARCQTARRGSNVWRP